LIVIKSFLGAQRSLIVDVKGDSLSSEEIDLGRLTKLLDGTRLDRTPLDKLLLWGGRGLARLARSMRRLRGTIGRTSTIVLVINRDH
jgi:hypothetical protein